MHPWQKPWQNKVYIYDITTTLAGATAAMFAEPLQVTLSASIDIAKTLTLWDIGTHKQKRTLPVQFHHRLRHTPKDWWKQSQKNNATMAYNARSSPVTSSGVASQDMKFPAFSAAACSELCQEVKSFTSCPGCCSAQTLWFRNQFETQHYMISSPSKNFIWNLQLDSFSGWENQVSVCLLHTLFAGNEHACQTSATVQVLLHTWLYIDCNQLWAVTSAEHEHFHQLCTSGSDQTCCSCMPESGFPWENEEEKHVHGLQPRVWSPCHKVLKEISLCYLPTLGQLGSGFLCRF